MTAPIEERLRARRGGWVSNVTYKDGGGDLINPDGPEAADLIAAQAARIAELEAAFYDYGQHIPNCRSLMLGKYDCNCGYVETARTALGDQGNQEGEV